MPAPSADVRLSLHLPNEAATARLAEDVAAVVQTGDMIALSGGLGAGKTSFARALLRALAGNTTLEVESPSFPLRIDHVLPRLKVVHVDLYRLADSADLGEIGLDEAITEAALLVEWPERLPKNLTADRLDIDLEIEEEGRSVAIVGHGSWPARLARTARVRSFLDKSHWPGAARVPLVGDASTRAYERVTRGGSTAIVMNAPARSEGPKTYDGRSYDAVAHRALDVRAFVAIDRALRDAGIHAPRIDASDLTSGVLLLEDLGHDGIVNARGTPILPRYEAAVDVLLHLHQRSWSSELRIPGAESYQVPPYDRDALLAEISLFPDYFSGAGGEPAFPPEERGAFLVSWASILAQIEGAASTLVLRDFHSPNVIWQEKERGLAQVAVIDFQDALIGHPAYDVVSLAQDARVALSDLEEDVLRARYVAGRKAETPSFDSEAFDTAYAVLGLQRATKILGIFTRLALTEGKSGYQRHRARLKALLRRNLAHPVLSPLRVWYEPHL